MFAWRLICAGYELKLMTSEKMQNAFASLSSNNSKPTPMNVTALQNRGETSGLPSRAERSRQKKEGKLPNDPSDVSAIGSRFPPAAFS
jgi:hypothetical protein